MDTAKNKERILVTTQVSGIIGEIKKKSIVIEIIDKDYKLTGEIIEVTNYKRIGKITKI